MTTWINPQPTSSIDVTHKHPGPYGDPADFPVNDTTAVTAVAATAENRYLTIVNNGPGRVLARRGGGASRSDYHHVFAPGFNTAGFFLAGGESLSLICNTGESATVKIGIASEVEN